MTIIIIVVIILVTNSIPVSQCHSPCPGFFKYVVDNRTREIFARLEIPHPPRNIALHLRVSLSVATILPTKYVGKIELARSRKESVKAIENGESLLYNIYFPLQRPVPLLTEILFNGHRYCIGHEAYGPIVTNMFLEHVLYPPGVNRITNAEETNDNDGGNKNKLGLKNCGKSQSGINPMANGARTLPGQWPWLAGIFASTTDLEFLCAGNLITDRHVITAARCFETSKGFEIPSNVLLISLGHYRLNHWGKGRGITHQVAEFRKHDEFISKRSAHADLAILVLREIVPITFRIKPICLWREPVALENILGITGFVVGWGTNEKSQNEIDKPQLARTRLVSQDYCSTSELSDKFNSERMFCASKGDGESSCNADNGSGLMLYDRKHDRYYLRGIISFSHYNSNIKSCDLKHYDAYIDLAHFWDWIMQQIS